VSLILKSITVAVLLVGCIATIEPTPSPVLIEDLVTTGQNAPTTLHCSNCPAIPVERAIDGDTFDSTTDRIRLYGVDTPESGEPCYDEATERLSELAGDSVRVEAGPRQGDPYDRSLFYVYDMAGQSIDEILIREGLALAWTEDGQHKDVLIAVEEAAKDNPAECMEEE
jgi:endonuclease YncB( thermonuclease family)